MESSVDKQWLQASKYLLDPLTAPGPSEETGPGTHYTSTFSPAKKEPSPLSPSTPKKSASDQIRRDSSNTAIGYPSPPPSSSPRQEHSTRRSNPFSTTKDGHRPRRSVDRTQEGIPDLGPNRRRVSSLTSRFPGDQSHRPLDMLKHDAVLANRSPHLRKKHLPGPDTIDSLDTIGGAYHHGGPFDATLLARNTSNTISPIQAVSASNMEALKATSVEKITDSVERHRPLDGVATIPPGMPDQSGRVYNYEEGADLMIEDGNYKRWPGVQYLPEDLKGKGEPAYSLEKALKDHKIHRRTASDGGSAIEMTARPTSSDGYARSTGNEQNYSQWDGNVQRSNTTGRKASNALTKRFGSLQKTRNDS